MRLRASTRGVTLSMVLLLISATGFAESVEDELMSLTKKLLTRIYVEPSSDFYKEHVAEDVTCYEGLPTRLDGIEYHLKALDALAESTEHPGKRHIELLNPKIQVYGDVGVVTATVQFATFQNQGVETRLLNETRVWAKVDGAWKLVHFHKSPVEWPPPE